MLWLERRKVKHNGNVPSLINENMIQETDNEWRLIQNTDLGTQSETTALYF